MMNAVADTSKAHGEARSLAEVFAALIQGAGAAAQSSVPLPARLSALADAVAATRLEFAPHAAAIPFRRMSADAMAAALEQARGGRMLMLADDGGATALLLDAACIRAMAAILCGASAPARAAAQPTVLETRIVRAFALAVGARCEETMGEADAVRFAALAAAFTAAPAQALAFPVHEARGNGGAPVILCLGLPEQADQATPPAPTINAVNARLGQALVPVDHRMVVGRRMLGALDATLPGDVLDFGPLAQLAVSGSVRGTPAHAARLEFNAGRLVLRVVERVAR
jgi:hypothetical protein